MDSLSLIFVNGSRTGSFPKAVQGIWPPKLPRKSIQGYLAMYPRINGQVSSITLPSILASFFRPVWPTGGARCDGRGKKKSVGVSAYSHARYHRVEEEGYSPFSSLSFLICSSTAFIFWASSDSSSRNLSAFFLARSTRLLPFLLLLVRNHRLFS